MSVMWGCAHTEPKGHYGWFISRLNPVQGSHDLPQGEGGRHVYLTEAPDGSYRLTPYSPELERQIALAETVMHEDRDILRALAK